MTGKLTLDKAGRVVLPKPVRDELNLSPGDTLEIETCGETITLHPLRITSPLRKERGVWVFRTGEKLTCSIVDETLRQVRDERHRSAFGEEP